MGLHVKVDSLEFSGGSCERVTRYTVTVVQSCYGTEPLMNPCALAPGVSMAEFSGGMGAPIYATCEFWLVEIDTTPPDITCDLNGYAEVDTIDGMFAGVVGSGVDCASGVMTLPSALVSENCNDIKLVKAIVEDTLGTFLYAFNEATGVYEPVGDIVLPFRDEPYKVILEAFDGCHNVGIDSCLLVVKDDTRPVASAHRGVNLEMNGKLTYLNVDQIDDDSYDNCEVMFVLGRRLDWQEGPL